MRGCSRTDPGKDGRPGAFTGAEINFNNNYGMLTTVGGEETVREVLVKEAAKPS
jgi:hypothetical protein